MTLRLFSGFLLALLLAPAMSPESSAAEFPAEARASAENPLRVTIYPRSRLKRPVYIEDGLIENKHGRIFYWNGWYFPDGTLPGEPAEAGSDPITLIRLAVREVSPQGPDPLLLPVEGWFFGKRTIGLSWPELLAAFNVRYSRPGDLFEERGIYSASFRNRLEFGADAQGARLSLTDAGGGAVFRRAAGGGGVTVD